MLGRGRGHAGLSTTMLSHTHARTHGPPACCPPFSTFGQPHTHHIPPLPPFPPFKNKHTITILLLLLLLLFSPPPQTDPRGVTKRVLFAGLTHHPKKQVTAAEGRAADVRAALERAEAERALAVKDREQAYESLSRTAVALQDHKVGLWWLR